MLLFLVLLLFLFYITAKGELPVYMGFAAPAK